MNRLTIQRTREIVDDFAKEIAQRKTIGPKPAKTVVNFRNERKDGIEREIYNVPVELLRYRKDNGRIGAEVLTHEKEHGLLDERTQTAQEILRNILKENDVEKNDELRHSMLHEGQREPAIITCDGFLINGNRRKMILETMDKSTKPLFATMKVVILPGKNDHGGPPTLVEIEQIENRYQHQSEGKAEYSKFNIALSIKRKIEMGMSLIEQLRDDPIYASRPEKEFEKSVKMFEEEYLMPLECIDRYLEYLGRQGLYNTIATGVGDREGRWQAFRDYHNFVYKKLNDEKQRMKLGVDEKEVGIVEDIAFKIIRKRELQNLPKAHEIMRNLPKWLANPDSKKALIKLSEIDIRLSKEECVGPDGKEYDERTKDRFWGEKNSTILHKYVNKAKNEFEHIKGQETPITLLDAALKKLNHENMQTDAINIADIPRAMEIVRALRERAKEIESEFYHYQKECEKLRDHHKKK